MDIILVDTSVWINYLKNVDTRASLFIDTNQDHLLAICPVVVQEVLQGVKFEQQAKALESYFNGLVHLVEDSYEIALKGAELYRKLRQTGITIRKPNDCLIAAYAISSNTCLLHDDKDFDFIAAHSNLKTIKF